MPLYRDHFLLASYSLRKLDMEVLPRWGAAGEFLIFPAFTDPVVPVIVLHVPLL